MNATHRTWLLVAAFTAVSILVFSVSHNRPKVSSSEKAISSPLASTVIDESHRSPPGRFRVVSIHDGDTLDVVGSDGVRFRLRLDGIDAPEIAQGYGRESKEALSKFVSDHELSLTESGRDKYGRYIAQLYCEGVWVNKAMLQNGCAWTYLAGSRYNEFKEAEQSARTKRVGLWSTDNPLPPWEARK